MITERPIDLALAELVTREGRVVAAGLTDSAGRCPPSRSAARSSRGDLRLRGPSQLEANGFVERAWTLCSPSVDVDGIRFSHLEMSLEAVVPNVIIRTVEVYDSPGEAPLQYTDGRMNGCGVILFWTGTPPRAAVSPHGHGAGSGDSRNSTMMRGMFSFSAIQRRTARSSRLSTSTANRRADRPDSAIRRRRSSAVSCCVV